jgi:1,4-dihydroxy-2-naphthoate octaprenyltransferase
MKNSDTALRLQTTTTTTTKIIIIIIIMITIIIITYSVHPKAIGHMPFIKVTEYVLIGRAECNIYTTCGKHKLASVLEQVKV